jgi:hypothetical protein
VGFWNKGIIMYKVNYESGSSATFYKLFKTLNEAERYKEVIGDRFVSLQFVWSYEVNRK